MIKIFSPILDNVSKDTLLHIRVAPEIVELDIPCEHIPERYFHQRLSESALVATSPIISPQDTPKVLDLLAIKNLEGNSSPILYANRYSISSGTQSASSSSLRKQIKAARERTISENLNIQCRFPGSSQWKMVRKVFKRKQTISSANELNSDARSVISSASAYNQMNPNSLTRNRSRSNPVMLSSGEITFIDNRNFTPSFSTLSVGRFSNDHRNKLFEDGLEKQSVYSSDRRSARFYDDDGSSLDEDDFYEYHSDMDTNDIKDESKIKKIMSEDSAAGFFGELDDE